MELEYCGVWPTMIAAFDEQGNLDLNANAQITNYLIKKGSDGLFAVCQSSEMFFLNLDEKVALAKCVVEASKGMVPVIASGHTSENIGDQINELEAISKTGVNAVVMVSNRLAKKNEDTNVFMHNLKLILKELPGVTFGIYECPYPYRRLLSNDELKWCADSGRIVFLKDVSCDVEIERERVKVVKGSKLRLFNANTGTLLDSLIAGYVGYNGVMGNFHIDIYKWLFKNYKKNLTLAREIQNELTKKAAIEKLAYPINAKYHMQLENVEISLFSRRLSQKEFTEDKRLEVNKLVEWESKVRKQLKISKL